MSAAISAAVGGYYILLRNKKHESNISNPYSSSISILKTRKEIKIYDWEIEEAFEQLINEGEIEK